MIYMYDGPIMVMVWAKSFYLNGTKLQTGSFLRGKWLTCSWTLTKLYPLATVEWFRKYFIIDLCISSEIKKESLSKYWTCGHIFHNLKQNFSQLVFKYSNFMRSSINQVTDFQRHLADIRSGRLSLLSTRLNCTMKMKLLVTS